ncbi:MAG: hypothetical protein LBQ49_01020 [Rickettsiales bacterium]|nr:hypothetical protein [Rickettsiales bacterium]
MLGIKDKSFVNKAIEKHVELPKDKPVDPRSISAGVLAVALYRSSVEELLGHVANTVGALSQ